MNKFQEDINKAIRHLQIANHMVYTTYPLINEKRFLLKIIEEINLCVIDCISFIIKYETNNEKSKPETIEYVSKRYLKIYNLTESQIQKIKEILEMDKRHKESVMEFVRNNKIVILSNNLGTKIIDIKLVKAYLLTAKELLLKINQKLSKN